MRVNRKSARALQVLVVFMAVALLFTAIPAVVFGQTKPFSASAEDLTSIEYSGGDAAAIINQVNSKLAGASNGGGVTLTLTTDLNVPDEFVASAAGLKSIFTVPANKILNIQLGTSQIKWEKSYTDKLDSFCWTSNQYQLKDNGGMKYVLIDNNGECNITGQQGSGISLKFESTNIDEATGWDTTPNFCLATAVIRTSNQLTVGKEVAISNVTKAASKYDIQETHDFYITAIGIYQTGGSVNSSGNIKTDTFVVGVHRTNNAWPSRQTNSGIFSHAYGIYSSGGHITQEDGSIEVSVDGGFTNNGGTEKKDSVLQFLSCGIYANSGCTVKNTKITTNAKGDNNVSGKDKDCLQNKGGHIASVGVLYSGTSYPTIYSDVVIDNTYDNSLFKSGQQPASQAYGMVGQVTRPPLNQFDVSTTGTTQGTWHNWDENVSNMQNTGSFYDESGNLWDGGLVWSTQRNLAGQERKTETSGGLPSGASEVKVVTVYRFYNNEGRVEEYVTKLDDSSKANPVTLTPSTANQGKINPDTVKDPIRFVSGGTLKNGNFYKPKDIIVESLPNSNITPETYTKAPVAFGKIAEGDDNGGWKQYEGSSLAAAKGQTLFVYVDYLPIAATTLSLKIKNATLNNPPQEIQDAQTPADRYLFTSKTTNHEAQGTPVVKLKYTGSKIQFSDSEQNTENTVSLTFAKEYTTDDPGLDDASRYKNDTPLTGIVEKLNSGALQLSVTKKDQKQVSTEMPTNVGEYSVTITIPAETTYSADPTASRNFKEGSFKFDLVIESRDVEVRANEPGFKPSLTYGDKLSSLNNDYLQQHYSVYPVGLQPEIDIANQGTFSWVAAEDTMPSVPAAGETRTYQLKWTPNNDNYNFYTLDSVEIDVQKRPLTITPKEKTIYYGEPITISADDVIFNDIVAADKPSILGLLSNQVLVSADNQDYNPYTDDGTFGHGSYTYKFAEITANNYEITYNTAHLTINPKELSLVIPKQTFVYDGTSTRKIRIEREWVSGLLSTTSYDAEGLTFSEEVDVTLDSSNVGETTGTITSAHLQSVMTGKKSANYKAPAQSVRFKATITAAQPKVPTLILENNTITYDPMKTLSEFSELNKQPGKGEDYAISTIEEGNQDHYTPGKWVWQINEKPTVNRSVYVAVFKPTNSNFQEMTQEVTVQVQKKEITVSVQVGTVTYGDDIPTGTYVFEGFDPQSPEKIESQPGGVIKAVDFVLTGQPSYTLAYDPQDPDNKDAKTYPITVDTSAMSADNYSFTARSGELVVQKKPLILNTEGISVPYGTASDEVVSALRDKYSVSGFIHGEENLASQVVITISAGDYTPQTRAESTATATFTASSVQSNYELKEGSATITVTKAVVTVEAEDIDVEYGTKKNSIEFKYTLQGLKNDEIEQNVVTGKPQFEVEYTSSTPAGSVLAISVQVSAMSAKNYTFTASEAAASLTVTKGKVTVESYPAYEVRNGLPISEATVSREGKAKNSEGDPVEGSFRIDKAQDTVLSYKQGDPQEIPVIFTPADSNYDSVKGESNITVTPNEVFGNLTITGSMMVGQKIMIDFTSMTPSDSEFYDSQTAKWTIKKSNGNTVEETGSLELNLKQEYEGAIIKFEIQASEVSGYTGKAEYAPDAKVVGEMTLPTKDMLTIPEETKTVEYDGGKKSFEVRKEDQKIGSIHVLYNGSSIEPVDAGEYRVTVDIAQSLENQMGPASGIEVGKLIITPRALHVSFEAEDKTYDGRDSVTVKNIQSYGKVTQDDVNVDTANARFRFENVNAGLQSVTMEFAFLTGADKNNYQIEQETCSAEIHPREVTAVATAEPQDYAPGKTTVDKIRFSSLSGVLAKDKNAVKLGVVTGIMTRETAGTNPVSKINYDEGAFVDKDPGIPVAQNYSFRAVNADSLTVEVRKINDPAMVYPSPITGKTYNAVQTLEDFAVELPENWSWVTPQTVPTVRIRTYQAKYTPENSNYQSVTAYVNVNIAAAPVTIYPDSFTIHYGDNAPSYTYRADGFTGSEGVGNCSGQIIISSGYRPGDDCKTYEITAKASSISNPNYTFDKTQTGTLNVLPRELKVEPYIEGSFVYEPDRTEVTVKFRTSNIFIKNGKPDDIRLESSEVQGKLPNNNAGEGRRVTFKVPDVIGSAKENYVVNVSPQTLNITIARANPNVVWPTLAKVEYNQRYSTAEFVGGSGDGYFELADASTTATELTSKEVDIRFVPSDPANYNTLTSQVTLNIVPAVLDMNISISGNLVEGNTLVAAISGVPQDAMQYLHYAWYRQDEKGVRTHVSDAETYLIDASDIGSYICLVVTMDPTAPYQAEKAEFVSAKKVEEVKLTFWQRLTKWWYAILAAIQSIFDSAGRISF